MLSCIASGWPQPAAFQQYEQESYEGGYGDLPSVDDLEVAAAAAAAAMEEVTTHDVPVDSNDDHEVGSMQEHSCWRSCQQQPLFVCVVSHEHPIFARCSKSCPGTLHMHVVVRQNMHEK